MKKSLFLAAALLPLLAFSKSPVPEHIENKAFDPAKPPILDEAKPSDSHSAPEWKKAAERTAPKCGKARVWKLTDKSGIHGTATKEKNVQVKGKFSRFVAYGTDAAPGMQGEGSLDLSSWDSGLPARDFRVQKYVFRVEDKGASVVPFRFRIGTWNPKEGDWESPVDLEFPFHGTPVKLRFPAKLHAEGKTVTVTSAESKKFTFLKTANLKPFQKMMQLCNHHFLASFAEVALELSFEEACAK